MALEAMILEAWSSLRYDQRLRTFTQKGFWVGDERKFESGIGGQLTLSRVSAVSRQRMAICQR
jgi:hypothetical protein